MKKEVSPVLVVVLILAVLTAVEVLYFRLLVGGPVAPMGGPQKGRPDAAAAEAPPVGTPESTVSTLAGAPEPGYRDGTAATARFDGPAAVAVDAGGTVYVADSRNHVIRKIAPTGQVGTLAGVPQKGFGGFADGPAAQTRFAAPAGLALLPGGELLVADTGNHRLRRISRDRTVTTFAGADTPHDELGRPTGGYRDGAAAQAEFRFPAGLAVGSDGAVYVADAGNRCVRRIAGGMVTTLPVTGGEMDTPTQVALSGGRLWVSDAAKSGLWTGPVSGPLQWRELKSASGRPFSNPSGVSGGPDGIYLLDAALACLFRTEGTTALLAGEQGSPGYADGPGDAARFALPAGLAVVSGLAYVADFGNNCIRTVTVSPHH